MKKLVSILAAAVLGAAVLAPTAAAEDLPQVTCEAYVVMDADTGQVIMEKNPDEVLCPASITKIMTLGLTMEKAQGDWSAQLTIDYDVAHSLESNSTHIALLPGEVVTLEDVIYGTQLESANDGANALAEYFGDDGTIASGVEKMNAKAQELGLTNTHYANPHGLYDENHYTSARDMANMTRWAMQQPGFMDVFCRNDEWRMAATNLQPERAFHCTDWLRVGGPLLYRAYEKGGKSGFHDQAGYTYVGYAEQDGLNLIVVVLKSVGLNGNYKDAAALLDYAFAHFRRVSIASPQDTYEVSLVGGGFESLGNVQVAAQGAEVLLNDAFTEADVTAELDIPEQYVLGQGFSATVTYLLKENALQPTTLRTVGLTVSGLEQILQANTYVPQKTAGDGRMYLGIGVAVAAAAIAILLAVRLIRGDGGLQSLAAKRARETGLPADFQIITRTGAVNSTPVQTLDVRRPSTKEGHDERTDLPRR